MYCKKCKNLIDENNLICPKCHFDNSSPFKETSEIALKRVTKDLEQTKKTTKAWILPLLILILGICLTTILMYVVKDSKSLNNEHITQPVLKNLKKETFKFGDLTLQYPGIFSSSTNSIYLKSNSAINIVFKYIDLEEYNDILNSNDCLDSKIGNIITKTFAGDNFYSHIFKEKNKYYDITINYINDLNIYNESLQLDISKILASIETK